MAQIRGYKEGFQALSEKYGVQTVVHNHSVKSMALHSGAAMNVVKGFDPQHVGIFADPGHLSLCGEPIEMALDMVQEYLSVLAFKDLIRQRPLGRPVQGQPKSGVMRMGQGFVDWPALGQTLKRSISFHSEYSGLSAETVIDLARIEGGFFEAQLGGGTEIW